MKRLMLAIFVVVVTVAVTLHFNSKPKEYKESNKSGTNESNILYYTCGMHPTVKISAEAYRKGNKSCPICHMDLVPVLKSSVTTAKTNENIISIDPRDLALAGIETVEVRALSLFKEIRTAGVVAYDPGLRTAQEEYIQALAVYEKTSQSQFFDAIERAQDMVDASKIKLRLLGENDELIKELESIGEPDDSLILPSENMWVYADIYEYEVFWPKIGDEAQIISLADTSVIFKGIIKAIDPVIKEKTRTLRLKIKVENKNLILKPNMYVDVNLKSKLGFALSIPKEAVLDTGKRKIIYLERGPGKFALKEVVVGPLAQGFVKGEKRYFYPLVEGAVEGDSVVLKGNFLIDSQSRLGASSSVYGGALGEKESAPMPGHSGH